MMKSSFSQFFQFSILIVSIWGCSHSKHLTLGSATGNAIIIKEGFIDCFEKGLASGGKPVWCEASAILNDRKNKVFFANDKEMPGSNSSVLYWMYKDEFADTTAKPVYLIDPFLKKGVKYEDFALTPNSKYVFLSTAFDRIKPGSTDWDGYNSVVYWKAGDEAHPQVLSVSGSDSTSVSYRNLFSMALASDSFKTGMPYFKIEGIAATDDKLYFGVREAGKKFDDFQYQVKIISVSYRVTNDKIRLENDFKLISDISIKSLEPTLPEKIGLSSIEYDKSSKRFFILTSYENGEKLGGYLWTASFKDLESNKMYLIKNADGSPLSFSHKPEDMVIVNPHKLIVIHDDDKVVTSVNGQKRNPNQAAYSIVEIK